MAQQRARFRIRDRSVSFALRPGTSVFIGYALTSPPSFGFCDTGELQTAKTRDGGVDGGEPEVRRDGSFALTSAGVARPGGRIYAGQVALVAAIAIATLLGLSRFDSSVYNNYVRLADAFVHGHAYIRWPGPYIDALPHDGKYYVIEGPVPGLLLVPVVAVFGRDANQTAFTCVIGGLAVAAAWHIARRLGASTGTAAVLATFLALGTDLTWCSMYGAVWYVAHVVAVFFALLAIAELLGAGRAWLVTLLLVLATGARFTLVLALPPLLGYALWKAAPGRRLQAVAGALAVLACAGGLFVFYNYVRWGVPNDVGYTNWYHQDAIGEPTGSPFRLDYLPSELQAFFLSFPRPLGHYPWLELRYDALALELTSPALVLALFARGERAFVAAMWIATALVATPSFVYYANGATQFGMRHALDFIPFMFPLLVLGARRVPAAVTDVLCGWSIAVGLWGLWYWRTFLDSLLVHHLPPGYN